MNSAVFLGKFSRHPSWTAVSQMVPETKTIHQSHGSVSNTTGGRGGPVGVRCAFSSTTVEAPVGPCAGAAEPPEATALGPTAQPRAPRANTATPGAGAAPRRTPVRGPGPRSAVRKPGCPGPLSRGSASLQTAQRALRGRASGPRAARAAAGPLPGPACPCGSGPSSFLHNSLHVPERTPSCPVLNFTPDRGREASACEDAATAGTPVTQPLGSRAGDVGRCPGHHGPTPQPPTPPPAGPGKGQGPSRTDWAARRPGLSRGMTTGRLPQTYRSPGVWRGVTHRASSLRDLLQASTPAGGRPQATVTGGHSGPRLFQRPLPVPTAQRGSPDGGRLGNASTLGLSPRARPSRPASPPGPSSLPASVPRTYDW